MRRFSVKTAITLLLLLGGGFTPLCAQQDDLSVFTYWKYYEGDPATSLYKHLYQTAAQQLAEREKAVAKLKTKADWQQRQALVQSKIAAALGPFPEKTPLNAVVTGKLEREEFTVEKLYFESRPSYYVTAALYLPKNKSGKLPAIVYASGHLASGFRGEAYQLVAQNFARKGFIVLAFDPIGQGERKDYQDFPLASSPTKEHSYPGAQLFVAGVSPGSYFAWDGIRAIDYLVSRPEVDAARIGMTGRSGGGTQTTYVAALDDRVRAAAPECYMTTFDKLLRSRGPQDAEQIPYRAIAEGLDLPDFVEVRAPKPTLLIGTTNDIFSIQGFRDAYREARKVYEAFGQPENLQKAEDDAEHASTRKNREAAYAFFQKQLDNPGSSEDLEVEFFSEEEMQVVPKEEAEQGLAPRETLFSLNKKYTRDLQQKRGERQKRQPLTANELRDLVIVRTGYEPPETNGSRYEREPIWSGRVLRPGYVIEKYLVPGPGDYYLPVLWLKPNQDQGKAVLLLDERGKAAAVAPGELADRMATEGHSVIAADLSGVGELAKGYYSQGDAFVKGFPLNLWFAGILTGKSLVAVRAEEIELLADFAKKTASTQPMTAVASGPLSADLLHAVVITNSFERTVLIDPLVSYQSLTQARLYEPRYMMSAVAGAVADYDLPDLAAAIGSEKILIVNPVDAAGMPLSQQDALTAYGEDQLKATKSLVRSCLSGEETTQAILDRLE